MAKITQIRNKSGDTMMPLADARGVVVGDRFLDEVLDKMTERFANVEKNVKALSSTLNSSLSSVNKAISDNKAMLLDEIESNEAVVAAALNNLNARIIAAHPEPKAGDICLVTAGGVKIFVTRQEYSRDLGTPIGIVVIPPSHHPSGKTIIMSLRNMSLQDPENGSLDAENVNGDNYMCWGGYGVELPLKNYELVPMVDPTCKDDGSVALFGWGNIPSDAFNDYNFPDNEYLDSLDGKGKYRRTSDEVSMYQSSYGVSLLVPSPYNADGSINDAYRNTECATSDFNGKENTAVIMQHITADISGVIDNSSAEGNYPAASCATLYRTEGTQQGDWYLPSLGELGYLMARLQDVKDSLQMLGEDDAVDIGCLDDETFKLGIWLWSSSECSRYRAWYLYTNNGHVDYNLKDYVYSLSRVRAFCAL